MIIFRSVTDEEALECLRKALRDLLVYFPLAGFSIQGEAVKVIEEEGVRSMATNGRCLWYSPSFVKQSGLETNIFGLLHEWVHIFGNHPARCGDRDKDLWQAACDFVTNAMCEEILEPYGLGIPTITTYKPQPWMRGLSVEQVFDELKERGYTPKPADGDDFAGDFRWEKMRRASEEEEQRFLDQFRSELAKHRMILEKAGTTLPGDLKSRLDKILSGTLPWGRLLAGELTDRITGDSFYTYAPPSRRFRGWNMPWGTPHIAPSLRSMSERLLLLAVDVSASVGESLLRELAANVKPAAARARETVLVSFDQEIREVIRTQNPSDLIRQMKLLSGAHYTTDVRPVFELVDELRPSATCVMTDAYVHYPERPYHDTVWVRPEGGGDPPWGKVFTMETSW